MSIMNHIVILMRSSRGLLFFQLPSITVNGPEEPHFEGERVSAIGTNQLLQEKIWDLLIPLTLSIKLGERISNSHLKIG